MSLIPSNNRCFWCEVPFTESKRNRSKGKWDINHKTIDHLLCISLRKLHPTNPTVHACYLCNQQRGVISTISAFIRSLPENAIFANIDAGNWLEVISFFKKLRQKNKGNNLLWEFRQEIVEKIQDPALKEILLEEIDVCLIWLESYLTHAIGKIDVKFMIKKGKAPKVDHEEMWQNYNQLPWFTRYPFERRPAAWRDIQIRHFEAFRALICKNSKST